MMKKTVTALAVLVSVVVAAIALSVEGVVITSWSVQGNTLSLTYCYDLCLTQADIATEPGIDPPTTFLVRERLWDEDEFPFVDEDLTPNWPWWSDPLTHDISDVVAALQADPNLNKKCKRFCVTMALDWPTVKANASGHWDNEGTADDPIEVYVVHEVTYNGNSASGTSAPTNVHE